MLQIIKITVANENHKIEWALSEYFEELKGKTFMLNKEIPFEEIFNNGKFEVIK